MHAWTWWRDLESSCGKFWRDLDRSRLRKHAGRFSVLTSTSSEIPVGTIFVSKRYCRGALQHGFGLSSQLVFRFHRAKGSIGKRFQRQNAQKLESLRGFDVAGRRRCRKPCGLVQQCLFLMQMLRFQEDDSTNWALKNLSAVYISGLMTCMICNHCCLPSEISFTSAKQL